jgi:hypothetical protein
MDQEIADAVVRGAEKGPRLLTVGEFSVPNRRPVAVLDYPRLVLNGEIVKLRANMATASSAKGQRLTGSMG